MFVPKRDLDKNRLFYGRMREEIQCPYERQENKKRNLSKN